MNAVRLPALAILLALAVGAFVFAETPNEAAIETAAPTAYTEFSPLGDSGDVWFCVGPTSRLEGIENRTIIITNLTNQPNEGLVTVVDNLGMWSERSIQLETGDRLELRTDQLVAEAQYAGITIEAPHGGLLVEQQIAASNTAGQDRQPCTTATVPTGQIPWGTTERPGTRQVILFHNPFQAVAVVDLTLLGDLDTRQTLDAQGLVIPGRSVVAYELTEKLPDSLIVSASATVRTGQLVMTGLQIADGTTPSGLQGLALTASSLTLSGDLFLPGSAEGQNHPTVVVQNPGDTTVELEIVIRTNDLENTVEPFGVMLRPGQRQDVDLHADGRLAEIGAYSIYVRSLDAPTLAAVAVNRQRGAVDEGEPFGPGLTGLPAINYGATQWWVDVIGSTVTPATVVIFNPGLDSIATVTLTTAADYLLPEAFELDPGDQVELTVDADVIIGIGSTAPIIVTRQQHSPLGWTTSYATTLENTTTAITR